MLGISDIHVLFWTFSRNFHKSLKAWKTYPPCHRQGTVMRTGALVAFVAVASWRQGLLNAFGDFWRGPGDLQKNNEGTKMNQKCFVLSCFALSSLDFFTSLRDNHIDRIIQSWGERRKDMLRHSEANMLTSGCSFVSLFGWFSPTGAQHIRLLARLGDDGHCIASYAHFVGSCWIQ